MLLELYGTSCIVMPLLRHKEPYDVVAASSLDSLLLFDVFWCSNVSDLF